MRNWLQMIQVHTVALTAEMIQLQAIGHRTTLTLPSNAMGHPNMPVDTNATNAFATDRAGPNFARRCVAAILDADALLKS